MFIKRLKSRIEVKFGGFYGWVIVLASFIIMVAGMGIVYNCSSLFIKPISEDLGFTRQQAGAIITIRNICTMVLSLFFGKIVEKFDLKKIMKISIVVLSIAYFSYSFVNTLSQLYIITVIVSIAFTFIGIMPLSIIINNWFYENCGTAMGLAFMGSGVGGMIFSFLTGQLIMSYGWRTTHQILAVIMFVTMAPAIFFMIYVDPKDKGTVAFGYTGDSVESGFGLNDGLTMKQALGKLQFWMILIISIFHSMSITTVMFNIAPHLSDEGYSIAFSANIAALAMGSLAISKIVLGKLYDKVGIKKSTTISSVATFFGLLGLIYSTNNIAIILIIIGAGMGGAFGSIAIPIITKEVFGLKEYATIYGVISAAKSLGGVLTPLLSGYTYDETGSYIPFFKISLIIIFIIILAYQYIFKDNNTKKEAKRSPDLKLSN